MLLGTSRKSTLGRLLDLPVDQRLEATLATTALGIAAGVGRGARPRRARERAGRADGGRHRARLAAGGLGRRHDPMNDRIVLDGMAFSGHPRRQPRRAGHAPAVRGRRRARARPRARGPHRRPRADDRLRPRLRRAAGDIVEHRALRPHRGPRGGDRARPAGRVPASTRSRSASGSRRSASVASCAARASRSGGPRRGASGA